MAGPATAKDDAKVALAKRLRAALIGRVSKEDDFASKLVGEMPLLLLRTDPAAVKRMAHSKLHSHYPFAEAPACWRRCFEEACLWAILHLLEKGDLYQSNYSGGHPNQQEREDEIIKLCDEAIIIAGSSHRRLFIDEVLRFVDDQQHEPSAATSTGTDKLERTPAGNQETGDDDDDDNDDDSNDDDASGIKNSSVPEEDDDTQRPAKRPRYEHNGPLVMAGTFPTAPISIALSNTSAESSPIAREHRVPSMVAPPPSLFSALLRKDFSLPLILDDTITHWPALTRWQDPRYWLRRTHGGRRRVPVEWGKSYVDRDWGQSIVPFGDFLRSELLDEATAAPKEANTKTSTGSAQPKRKGYLAQHDLLAQIPALRNDIAIPDYCYCPLLLDDDDDDDDEQVTEPMLNVWLGPADTVSPAHTDPHHNLFAQVVGSKYVRLFAPLQSSRLYPMESNGKDGTGTGYSMANTSSVDVGLEVDLLPYPASSAEPCDSDSQKAWRAAQMSLQREKFPNHQKAEYFECILKPGQVLFIPKGWWHYIRSLEVSCNVSFWWD